MRTLFVWSAGWLNRGGGGKLVLGSWLKLGGGCLVLGWFWGLEDEVRGRGIETLEGYFGGGDVSGL